MTEDLREPVHRRFVIIDDYEHERKYEGIEIPYRWQAWETANFFRIDSILDPGNEKMPVRLISYGCNNGDPERLNCTETCSNRTLMYNSPENLWNCMTLATMAMVIVPGDDTIDEATEEEAAEKFGFGSLEEFNKLNVFTSVRNCVWASCSDSAYGKCTSSLHRFQCTRIHPDNIASFGRVLEGPYCQAADAGIDFDIAGQGVVISYIIQYILVIVLGVCFKVVTSWVRNAEIVFDYFHSKRKNITQGEGPWQKAVSQNRFSKIVASSMVDLQEAQALFAAVISVATIAAFAGNSGTGLANVRTLFSWILNNNILQGLVTVGMYPVLMVQLLLHRYGNRWWYTMFLVILNWVFMIIITQASEVDTVAFEKHLRENSGVEACGGNPGPMSYCQGIKDKTDYGYFEMTLWRKTVVHIVSVFLIIDWLVSWIRWYWIKRDEQGQQQSTQSTGHGQQQRFTNFLKSSVVLTAWSTILWILWIAMEILTFAMMIIALQDLQELLSLHITEEGMAPWSFGQLIAVAVWLPVVFKFAVLLIDGFKAGLNQRLDKDYEVSLRNDHVKDHPEVDEAHQLQPVKARDSGGKSTANSEHPMYEVVLAAEESDTDGPWRWRPTEAQRESSTSRLAP